MKERVAQAKVFRSCAPHRCSSVYALNMCDPQLLRTSKSELVHGNEIIPFLCKTDIIDCHLFLAKR